MPGTDTGLKWLQRKARLITGPQRDEGIITQTDASQDQSNATRLGHAFDSQEIRDAAWNQRMNAAEQYRDAKEADERKAKGKAKGGSVKGETIKSASKRADGIAARGKTRGKMV